MAARELTLCAVRWYLRYSRSRFAISKSCCRARACGGSHDDQALGATSWSRTGTAASAAKRLFCKALRDSSHPQQPVVKCRLPRTLHSSGDHSCSPGEGGGSEYSDTDLSPEFGVGYLPPSVTPLLFQSPHCPNHSDKYKGKQAAKSARSLI